MSPGEGVWIGVTPRPDGFQFVATQLCAEIDAALAGSNEPKRAILTDLLWKMVRGDYHGVMDCAADMRELHL